MGVMSTDMSIPEHAEVIEQQHGCCLRMQVLSTLCYLHLSAKCDNRKQSALLRGFVLSLGTARPAFAL